MMQGNISKLGAGVVGSGDELAERGTAEFYREQVARLLRIAETVGDPTARLELLEMASVFQRLADRSATVTDLRTVAGKKSA